MNTNSGHPVIWQTETKNDSQAVPALVSKIKLFVASNNFPNDASHYKTVAKVAKI